jgi:alcohol dehydrogenase
MKFMFGIPSFVTFGEGCTENLAQTILSLGGKNVFCVYDQGIKKAGVTDQIIDNLKNAGLNVVEYDGVLPNPPDIIVEEAAFTARKWNTDIILAIGGAVL